MAGLILLAAVIALVALLIWLSGLLTRWLPLSSNSKTVLRVVIFIGAFPLMLADEIIGKYQFERLCKTNGIESVDLSRGNGKYVKRESGARNILLGLIIPIKFSNEVIRDASTNESLFSYKDYYAKGGWLVRYTPINMGSSSPMLFDGNGCGFQSEQNLFLDHKINQIN